MIPSLSSAWKQDWICAPEAGETDDGPWEVFRILDQFGTDGRRHTCLLAYGLDEESARTIAQRLND